MTFTLLRQPWPVILKPGLLALFATMSLGAGMLISTRRLALTGHLVLTWQEAVLAGTLVVSGLILHETGHAVAARATGRTVERLVFGFAGGAATSGDTTPWRRAAAIAAGPLADLAYGSALWGAGGAGWDNPVGAAGLLVLINGIGNILPLHKALDGYRLLLFIRMAIRGNKPLVCTTEGPCTACTGARPAADVMLAEQRGPRQAPASGHRRSVDAAELEVAARTSTRVSSQDPVSVKAVSQV
jgi:membrane-associated protease RseP (regulator of RpoE activity)